LGGRAGGYRADGSDALVSLVGEPRLSRPQTVKRIWEYIKGNSLQDPSDGRFILCDGPMKAVFNTDKLHMFT
jgi:upstream activation factor subunit UAF30